MLATLRRRDFGLLWFGSFISEAGDWMLVVGLPVYVYLLTGSALQTSALFLVELLPTVVLGSVAGVFVDRWDRRRTLVIGLALQGTALFPLLTVHSGDRLWVVYGVALIESIVNQFMVPASNALLPNLVPEEQVVTANSLTAVGYNLARLVGAPLGGFVVGLWSLTGVVVLDAVSFFLATVLIARVSHRPRRDAPWKKPDAGSTWLAVWREWRAGLTLVRRSRTISALFALIALQAAAQGIFLVLFVVWVLNVLHGGAAGVGWLRGVQAIGGLLGGITVAWLGPRVPPPWLIVGGSIGFGLVELAIWNSAPVGGLALATVLFVAVGIPGAAHGAGFSTMLQMGVEDAYRGRIFGAMNTTYSVLQGAGMGVAGFLGDRISVLPVLNVQAGIYVLTGLLAALLLRSVTARAADQSYSESA